MKLFVWDFHGVLEIGNNNAVIEITNTILKNHGCSREMSEEESHQLYGKCWYEYFEHLLPEESHEIHIKLQQDCFEMSNNNPEIVARHIQPNDHACDVLKEIGKKHDQILISNTRPDSLIMFLNSVGITKYFPDKSFAVDGHGKNAKTKSDVLKEFLEGKQYDKIVIIGDSHSDMDMASSSGGTSYLYAYPDKKFKECESHYKITDLRDVLKEI